MEKCYLLEMCSDVNNHKFFAQRETIGICRNVETLSEVLKTSYNCTEVNSDNVFSFEMRQKYGYKIYDYFFFDWK